METKLILLIISIVVGVYEVLARSIPSISNWSVLHFIIELLRKLSELLNRKKR